MTGLRIADGEIIEEVLWPHRRGGSQELRKFLGYPMNYWCDAAKDHGTTEAALQKLIKQRVFGQLSSLCYNHRELMRKELPTGTAKSVRSNEGVERCHHRNRAR